MGWIGTWNDEHQAHAVAAIAVASPTDDDVHEVVDRYLETTTGYCAARVHDTDLAAALAGGALVSRSVVTGADVAVPAGVLTWLTDWVDVRTWRSGWVWVTNTGGAAIANVIVYFSPLLVPGAVLNGFLMVGAVGAGQTQWFASRATGLDWGGATFSDPSLVGAVAMRLGVTGGANPTTCTGRIALGRG